MGIAPMLAYATIRLSAPSSSRMLLTTLRAMNSITSEPDRDAHLLGLGAEDRDPRLEVRGGQVGDEPPFEPAPEALLERHDLLRRPVGREDDLLAVLVDRVERVEELLLRPLLVGDELDVVDEEEVDPPVAVPGSRRSGPAGCS